MTNDDKLWLAMTLGSFVGGVACLLAPPEGRLAVIDQFPSLPFVGPGGRWSERDARRFTLEVARKAVELLEAS